MFEALKDAGTVPGVDAWQVQFAGFDGNSETAQMGYAAYFCSLDRGRFTQLEKGDNFNSHAPSLARYRGQLEEWRACKNPNRLSVEDVKRVAGAASHRGKK